MKVKFANRIYEVLLTKELAGLTMYAVEDEPNHIDWLINVEVIDAEKKELKKIEQKPADKVEPKFKVGDVVTNKKSKDTVKIVQILHDSYCYSGWDGAATIYSDFSISEQDDWELVELTACNEEGESKYSEDDIAAEEKAEYKKGFECGKQLVLKYPEDFGLCKKPAWSEEDEEILRTILSDGIRGAELDMLQVNWLKSLRPQNNITDEELAQAKKNAYNNALDKIEYHSGEPTFDDGWSAAIDYIRKKSIRLQNKWKPSELQLGCLSDAIEHYNSLGYPAPKLKELYEQLKKL